LTEGKPTVLSARETLAAELRRGREIAGVSGRELARRAGLSQSKVSRIESGATLPTVPEVAAWSEAVNATEAGTQRLADLAEAAFTESRLHLQDQIADLENQAALVRTFQPALVPGLLQTAQYARRVFALFDPPYSASDIPAVVASRLDRQLALFDEGRSFEFLITEAALRWRPGPPSLLRGQLDRIASLGSLSNVTIGLIPLAVEATVSTVHSFVIFESLRDEPGEQERALPDAPGGFVTVETAHANLTVKDPKTVALYRRRWTLLADMAIYDEAARAFLESISCSLTGGLMIVLGTYRAPPLGAPQPSRSNAPGGFAVSSWSAGVEQSGFHPAGEVGPFVQSVDEHRAVRVLGVAHCDHIDEGHFHAATTPIARSLEFHGQIKSEVDHVIFLPVLFGGGFSRRHDQRCVWHLARHMGAYLGMNLGISLAVLKEQAWSSGCWIRSRRSPVTARQTC
jgi:transcriptional regulator with XRE-family HTH domain